MGWAPTPVLMHEADSFTVVEVELLSLNCEHCLSIEATHTVTTYTVVENLGAVYDPDDGLPLAFEGERSYGDGRLYNGGTHA